MARDESDREDLLREASALVERIEIEPLDKIGGRIVIGFRTADALSVFFDSDRVYQFNTAGELRRAFWQGRLLKAENSRLIALERIRRPHEVQLVRHNLTDDEQQKFLAEMCGRLLQLAAIIATNRYTFIGQAPPDADVLGRVREWLANHKTLAIARAPNVENGGGS